VLEKISNYKIIKKLGEGGMGEVYLAEDVRLSRKVALKILPSSIGKDRKNLNRFLQEARLAANLNHPNICTIYEVGETDETPFLAMELVEGVLLADKIASGELKLQEILQIASQIADALDEAHKHSVIHRDIKASNVIINLRGQVKVLDFGLAKIIAEEVSDQDITRAKTEEGMLVGTVQYMSPEQALGKKLDGRTDLWSLGVLIYEMACRIVPFKAVTHAGVFDEILHKQPVSPSALSDDVPAEFETIILKLLEKDRNLRYQTASDLFADLKRLRRNLGESFDSTETIKISSSNFQSQNIPTGKKLLRFALPGILAIALLGGIGFVFYSLVPKASAKFSIADSKASRVTSLGKIGDATVSEDGKYIAYVLNEGSKQSLWLKQTENGGNVQILPSSDVVFQGTKISSDGNWIYYNLWDKKTVGEIFRVPILGGIPQKVIRDCMPGLTISPDGKKMAFIRSDDQAQSMKLISASTDGKDEKVIHESINGKSGIYSAAFAPDGKTVAILGDFPDSEGNFSAKIVEIPSEGGEFKVIWKGGDQSISFASSPQWLPDKSGLLVSMASGEIYNQLWLIDYNDGTQTLVNNDFNSYDSLSITADGKTFVGVQREFLLSVWTLSADNPSQAKRITEGKMEGVGVDWTPNGKLVYSSNLSGTFNLWQMNSDGTEKSQITNDTFSNIFPCVSLDGNSIFFSSNKKGYRRIGFDGTESEDKSWRKYLDGGGCMQSENSLLYYSFDENSRGFTKLDFNTNEKKLVVPESDSVLPRSVQQFAISPDGKKAFYVSWDDKEKRIDSVVWNLQTNEKKAIIFPKSAIDDNSSSHYNFRWMNDSKNLAVVDSQDGVSNLWIYPIDGGKPKQLTDFNDNKILSISFSRDGKQIAISRGTTLSDVVIFRINK
jgi:eukaryotic-like serine/threonine-protein kinase